MRHQFIRKYLFAITITALLIGCRIDTRQDGNDPIDQYSYDLGTVGGFSELIAAGVKQLALSAPMSSEEMNVFIVEAEKIATKHGVSIFREPELIVTDLFQADIAQGLEVLLLYTGTTKDEYLNLKADQSELEKNGDYNALAKREISRRFGRMLSYSPRKINQLLSQNTSFRTMDDFGIRANNLFLYYKDLKAAGEFYTEIMGMELVADYKMALILRMAHDSYLILVDANKGMHTADEPKTVALALITDQLDEWYAHLKNKNVKIKYEYKPTAGGAHDGFVIVDPEGYLLEIERFKQHPENERFVPILDQNKKKSVQSAQENSVPNGLTFHSTITWLYHNDVLAMQNFYQDVFGLEMVADQGWAKIYKVSQTGFMGIVDGSKGMHKFTEKKAVNVGFIIDELTPWFDYVRANKLMELKEEELGIGPEAKYKAFVGFGPEAYFYEFDAFFPHDDNTLLMKYLNSTF